VVADAFGGITVAPVPFRDRLTVTFGAPMTRSAEVTLIDASGRLLFRQGFGAGGQRFTVEAQDLPAGVSLLQVDDGVKRVVKRVVRLP